MKTLKNAVMILLSGSLLIACVSTPKPLDEKYIFSDLVQVNRLHNYNLNGWSSIDRQSLLVNVSPSTSYLIVLRQPHKDLRSADMIRFPSATGSTVNAKFDYIEIVDLQSEIQPFPAYINRIYKLNSREDEKMVKAQIRGQVYIKPVADTSDKTDISE